MADNEDGSLDGLFEQLVREILPSTVITNFLLVAEVVNEDGTDLNVTVSSNLTPWLALGMIRSAEAMIVSGECNFPNQ
ncbi:MAG: hypothetical protein ACO3CH_00635 [Ilumatobacteraceae bacterium]|nr:hypothetical protein [Chitinophagales bacterium]